MDFLWLEVRAEIRRDRDMLNKKLDLCFALESLVRAPLSSEMASPCMVWRLSAEEDLWVTLEANGRFSAWISTDNGRKALLGSGGFDALLAAIVPLVPHEVSGDSCTQKGKTA